MNEIEPAIENDSEERELDKALHHLQVAKHDLEKANEEEVRAARELEEAEKEIEEAVQDRWIVINGHRKTLHAHRVTFEELVNLAFPIPPQGVEVQFTVQYTRGPDHKPTGTLIEGQSVKIRDGMEFDVTSTNRS